MMKKGENLGGNEKEGRSKTSCVSLSATRAQRPFPLSDSHFKMQRLTFNPMCQIFEGFAPLLTPHSPFSGLVS